MIKALYTITKSKNNIKTEHLKMKLFHNNNKYYNSIDFFFVVNSFVVICSFSVQFAYK